MRATYVGNRRLLVLVAALALLVPLNLQAQGAPAHAQEPSPPACGRTVAAADPAVRDLASDLGLDRAEAVRRIGWQSAAESLSKKLQSRVGDAYGGVWIDSATGRVQVGVTESAERATARSAASQCGLGDGADVVSVRNSAERLTAAADWISDRFEDVGKPGTAVGIDHAVNRVVVDIPGFRNLTGEERAALALVRKRYPDTVTTQVVGAPAQPAACTADNRCDPPLRGGVWITNGRFACTLGFLARSKSSGALYAMTAGHCGGGTWSTSFANGTSHVIGPRTSGQFGPEIDAQIIRINNPAGWNPRPWVLVESSSSTTANKRYPIHRVGSSVVGMRLCETGFNGSTKCGRVTRVDVFVEYDDGTSVRGLGEADFCVVGGDSGGPNYASNTAYGLTSGSRSGTILSPCRSYYQGVAGAASKLNVSVVTGS